MAPTQKPEGTEQKNGPGDDPLARCRAYRSLVLWLRERLRGGEVTHEATNITTQEAGFRSASAAETTLN